MSVSASRNPALWLARVETAAADSAKAATSAVVAVREGIAAGRPVAELLTLLDNVAKPEASRLYELVQAPIAGTLNSAQRARLDAASTQVATASSEVRKAFGELERQRCADAVVIDERHPLFPSLTGPDLTKTMVELATREGRALAVLSQACVYLVAEPATTLGEIEPLVERARSAWQAACTTLGSSDQLACAVGHTRGRVLDEAARASIAEANRAVARPIEEITAALAATPEGRYGNLVHAASRHLVHTQEMVRLLRVLVSEANSRATGLTPLESFEHLVSAWRNLCSAPSGAGEQWKEAFALLRAEYASTDASPSPTS